MASRIPNGAHTLTPHLVAKGASEAIDFYKQAFGAVELVRLPIPAPDGGTKIMHASVRIGDSWMYLADEFPEHGILGPNGGGSPITIHLSVEDADEVFDRAVAAGATVTMPLADMFWGARYGKLVDPFGHHWSISHQVEEVTPEQAIGRMPARMLAGAEA